VKGISAGVRVAILFVLLAIAGYVVWKTLSRSAGGDGAQKFFALFRDAVGLPKSGKVVVAGLAKGEITGLEVQGRYARVDFTLGKDVEVWSSAVVIKKATSLLGENYLEVDPGEKERQKSNGTKELYTRLGMACTGYDSDDPKVSDPCRQIRTVVEATTVDQLLHRIEQTVPHVDAVLDSVRDLSDELKKIATGPIRSVADRLDGLVQREAPVVQDAIERADRSLARIEAITNDLRDIARDGSPKIKKLLDNLDEASADAKDLIAVAKGELKDTGAKLREKLDRLDGVIENTRSITSKIDSDKGTLGILVNDPTIANNVEQITDDVGGFVSTVFRLKAYVGLRSEWNFRAGLLRSYISAELHTRPDKYYLIEFEKGPRGDYPDVELTFNPTIDPNNWIRTAVIHDAVRITFQFAKRFGPITLRFGIKESTGGLGLDYNLRWWSRDLRLSADVFDATWDTYPRVKLTAAYEVFRYLYVLGGVDDLLNTPANLPIVTGNSQVPVQFQTFAYGRDYFAGLMLRFTDEDLAALLTVGGSALVGAAK
jgi:phospholipid/cholesterol/gamma-HCH transport system substrate-binding protein